MYGVIPAFVNDVLKGVMHNHTQRRFYQSLYNHHAAIPSPPDEEEPPLASDWRLGGLHLCCSDKRGEEVNVYQQWNRIIELTGDAQEVHKGNKAY
jgi:hypothetical protein